MTLLSIFTSILLVVKNLGSSPFIGKSSIFIGIQNQFQVILDAGCHSDGQTKPILDDFNFQKYKFQPSNADALIISHAHIDHVGALINTNFEFKNKIMMSKVTKALTLMNINQTQKMSKGEQNNQFHNRQFMELEYFKPYKLNDYSDATVTIFPVPHISGSSFILITCNNRKILYTGDFNTLYPQFIQENFIFYQELQNIDVLITETTFSSTVFQMSQQMQLNQYADCLINILSKNQTVLTTSAQDAINYLQIISHLCDRLKLQNFITTSKKPFSVVEGATRTYLQAITVSGESDDLTGQRGIFFRDFFNARNIGSQQLLVTTPKQVNAACSLESLFQFGSDPNALFLLTGAVQPGSYNWRLINKSVKEIKRDNQKIYTTVNAEFEQIGQLGHTDFNGLLKLIKQCQCKVVIGTHCAQIENLKLFEQMSDVFGCRVCCLVGVISLRLWKDDDIIHSDDSDNYNLQQYYIQSISSQRDNQQRGQQQKLFRVKTDLSKQYILDKFESLGIPNNQNLQIQDDGTIIIYCGYTDVQYLCEQLGCTL